MADECFFELADLNPAKVGIYDHNGKEYCSQVECSTPQKWRILAEPMYYENRYTKAWGDFVYCLVCQKVAGNDHIASGRHRQQIQSSGISFLQEYRRKIQDCEIPLPTDGLNHRDSYGRIDNVAGEPPAEVDRSFAPVPKGPPLRSASSMGSVPQTPAGSECGTPCSFSSQRGGPAGFNATLAPVPEDMSDPAFLSKLRPIDAFCREIPHDEFFWNGSYDGYEDYLLELWKNPQYYEIFDHNGWPALRCRLCPGVAKINSSHTPDGKKHLSAVRCVYPGQYTLEYMDMDEAMEHRSRKCKNMPLPIPSKDLIPGVHFPHDFDAFGQLDRPEERDPENPRGGENVIASMANRETPRMRTRQPWPNQQTAHASSCLVSQFGSLPGSSSGVATPVSQFGMPVRGPSDREKELEKEKEALEEELRIKSNQLNAAENRLKDVTVDVDDRTAKLHDVTAKLQHYETMFQRVDIDQIAAAMNESVELLAEICADHVNKRLVDMTAKSTGGSSSGAIDSASATDAPSASNSAGLWPSQMMNTTPAYVSDEDESPTPTNHTSASKNNPGDGSDSPAQQGKSKRSRKTYHSPTTRKKVTFASPSSHLLSTTASGSRTSPSPHLISSPAMDSTDTDTNRNDPWLQVVDEPVYRLEPNSNTSSSENERDDEDQNADDMGDQLSSSLGNNITVTSRRVVPNASSSTVPEHEDGKEMGNVNSGYEGSSDESDSEEPLHYADPDKDSEQSWSAKDDDWHDAKKDDQWWTTKKDDGWTYKDGKWVKKDDGKNDSWQDWGTKSDDKWARSSRSSLSSSSWWKDDTRSNERGWEKWQDKDGNADNWQNKSWGHGKTDHASSGSGGWKSWK
ncbi:unnamed protein product [Amoebophrya sp. A25]|nr:unnamed protein product [Amoebophrya sp. A25]|eukprot:GSA25T00016152001.1